MIHRRKYHEEEKEEGIPPKHVRENVPERGKKKRTRATMEVAVKSKREDNKLSRLGYFCLSRIHLSSVARVIAWMNGWMSVDICGCFVDVDGCHVMHF